MSFYTIWDIDNCLADDGWRMKYVEFDKHGDERYREYNSRAHYDQPKHQREFALFTRMGATPVFFSGRPEYMREMTISWLKQHFRDFGLPETPLLFLRGNGTVGLTPRACKASMLRYFGTVFSGQVIAAFDDIPAIVEMYRENGIPATVLNIHTNLAGAYEPADLK